MARDTRSTLVPVLLAGVVAAVVGVVVVVGFGKSDGTGSGTGAAQPAAAAGTAQPGGAAAAEPATSTTADAGGPAPATTSADTATAAAATTAAPEPATTAPLPQPGCTELAAELDAVDAALARLIGEDAPGPDDEIPGAAQLAAFAGQLDRLEASAPGEIRARVQALARIQRDPVAAAAAAGPAAGEQQVVDALSGLADAVQSSDYLDESDAARTWVASHCG